MQAIWKKDEMSRAGWDEEGLVPSKDMHNLYLGDWKFGEFFLPAREHWIQSKCSINTCRRNNIDLQINSHNNITFWVMKSLGEDISFFKKKKSL